MPKEEVIAAHAHCSNHRQAILNSRVCGCFYCLATFPPGEILDWVDERPDGDGISADGTTALCPRCGIDSVIGSSCGYPISAEFLDEMNQHWFQESVPLDALPNKRLHLTAAVGGVRTRLAATGRRLLASRPAAVVASWFARGRR